MADYYDFYDEEPPRPSRRRRGGRQQVREKTVPCAGCTRLFVDQNAMRQHAQVHAAADTPCPGCGRLYRGVTNAVLHFETGYCSGCPGRENARRAAYDFASAQETTRQFLTQPLMLTYDDGPTGGFQAEAENYKCPACTRTFNALGSLMQHQQARPQCRQGGGSLGTPQLRIDTSYY